MIKLISRSFISICLFFAAFTAQGGAILFVSFSMPDLALKQYFVQAKHYHIPMVVRGLVNNSFRDTANKVFDLSKQKNIGGIEINPVSFEKFSIKQVPALVVFHNCDSKNICHKANFDVIYGNIPIHRSLEIIAKNGDISAQAKSILQED